VTSRDLHISQVSPSVEHGRNVGVAQHVRMGPGDLDAGGLGEVPQAAGGRMAVHPGAAGVQQDRPAVPHADRPVDGPADRGRQRDQDDLGSLAAHSAEVRFGVLARAALEAGQVGSHCQPQLVSERRRG
jgi:hypothetical protein